LNPPPGCHFHPRCPIAREGLCDVEAPHLMSGSDTKDHLAACWLRASDRAIART
jgi:ABC-type dipeptide/oligopeptide/nickel transport system ATPase component